MKKTGKKAKANNGCITKLLHIEFNDPIATSVAIAGSFNNWRPASTPMIALGLGKWVKDMILPPGRYEYLIVADGQWRTDPSARETVPNAFGGVNSVVVVDDDRNSNGKR